MTEKEARRIVRRKIEELGQSEFARLIGTSRMYVCDVYHGKTMGPKVLAACGLKKKTVEVYEES